MKDESAQEDERENKTVREQIVLPFAVDPKEQGDAGPYEKLVRFIYVKNLAFFPILNSK